MSSSIGRPVIAIRCPTRSPRAVHISSGRSSSFGPRSFWRSGPSPRSRSSIPSSRSASCAEPCTAITASRWSSPTTRLLSSATPLGSDPPGKMSSSPAEYSITPARDAYRDRRPPYSEDAEQAVLAAMLMDQDAILRATEYVDDTMFYREAHRRLFRAMVAISERGDVVDPLTLADELSRRGELDQSGGKDYIGFLVDAVPTAANVEYHAKMVREKALLRRLIETSTSIVSEAFEGMMTAAELLDDAEHKLFQVSQQRGTQGFTRIKELMWPTMERIESLQKGGQTITGVPTGFSDLDEMTSGFQLADLVIIAARPSMGKTAIVLNIAQYAAIERNIPIAIFSLEMSKESLVQRMLTAEARVDAQKLRKGMLRDDDFGRIARAAGVLNQDRKSV